MISISELTFFGSPIIYFQEIDSTNDYLKNQMEEKPLLVIADYQTNGRGQYGNTWESNQNENILLSLQIYPQNEVIENGHLYIENTALCVVQTINQIIGDNVAYIKWPNDILINNKKVCGVLMESQIQKNQIQKIIVGIGINVEQLKFPKNLQYASSIKNEFPDLKISKLEVLELLIKKLEYTYINLNEQRVQSEYNQSLYRLHQIIKIKKNNQIMDVLNRGIDVNGNWLLEVVDTNEILAILSSREIEYIY